MSRNEGSTCRFNPENGDAMKKAWGEPKEEDRLGKTRCVFSEEPFLVFDDSIGRAWEIETKAKRD